MVMKTRFEVGPGYFDAIQDIISVNGDRKRPNPHQYMHRRTEGSYTTDYWYVADTGGPVINAHTNQCDTTIRFPEGMEWCNSNQVNCEIEWDRLKERCLEKIYDKLRGNSEIIVDLAEAGQTIKMLKAVLSLKKNFTKVAADFLKSKNKKRKLADLSTGKWLEYRYGWVPLFHTIYDAAENLRKKVFTEPVPVKARSGIKVHKNWNSYDGRDGDFFLDLNARNECSAMMEYGMLFKPPDPMVQQVASWTSLNPASIAWELVPLSFVADWFVNVGDNLRSWENWALFSSSFMGGYETKLCREFRKGYLTRGTRQPNLLYWPDGQSKTGYYGSRVDAFYQGYFSRLERTVLTSLPMPVGFHVRFDLNAKRVVDAAALTNRFWKRFL
jgi:hypothetical protein